MVDAINSIEMQIALKTLDFLSARQQVIAHNLANASVEGFHVQRIEFEQALRDTQDAYASQIDSSVIQGHLNGTQPVTRTDRQADSVDIDAEMLAAWQNELQFETVLSAIERRGRLLRTAITGGV